MGKPKRQFSRPSINLSTEKRDWLTVPASRLQVGDTVRGWGLVEKIQTLPDTAVVNIFWKNGTNSVVLETDEFFAFVKV